VTGLPATSGSERVLLIEDDPDLGQRFGRALRALDMDGAWVRTGAQGLAALRRSRVDLLLLGMRLPDGSALDVLRTWQATTATRHGESLRAVLVRSSRSTSAMTDCLGPGVLGIVDALPRSADIVAAVTQALRLARDPRASRSLTRRAPRSITERWAALVLETIDAERDPRTITGWAKWVGVSRSMIGECCRLVRIATHDACDFARLLRAICQSGRAWQPEAVLDLADQRTVKRLLARAGLSPQRTVTPTTGEFLACQRWIPQDNPGLHALRVSLFGTVRERVTSVSYR
jgi:CheY-like chemotaxis protein